MASASSGAHQRYPDGIGFHAGFLRVRPQNRETPSTGITHKPGDGGQNDSARFGHLVNVAGVVEGFEPRTLGSAELMLSFNAPIRQCNPAKRAIGAGCEALESRP